MSTLKVLRISKGLSRSELADLLNLSESGYAKLERGETRLDIDRAKKLSEVFNVPIEDLVNSEFSNINDYSTDRTGDNNLIKGDLNRLDIGQEVLNELRTIRELLDERLKQS